jgi:hypothetical protein
MTDQAQQWTATALKLDHFQASIDPCILSTFMAKPGFWERLEKF